MPLKNKWVGYTQRGYLQIKQSIRNRVSVDVPEQTDFSESNIFVILVSIFSGLIEQINYYIDQLMRESFVTTARRYSSLVRHSRLFDYRIRAASPAYVDVLLILKKDGEEYTLQVGESEKIPLNTLFTSDNGLQWRSLKDIQILPGQSRVMLPLSQFVSVSETYTIPNSDPDQVILIGTRYVHNSMNLSIAGELWELVTTFGRSLSTDRHYIIDIGLDGVAYVMFGDGTRGLIPSPGSIVNLSYHNTSGLAGNISTGSITDSPSITLTSEADEIEVNNLGSASGGNNYENIESLRKNIPLSLRVLDRAVTKKDYSDIATLHPGVKSAYAYYECDKYVDIYIAPTTITGGIASLGLLNSVHSHFQNYKMITTFINVMPAGISLIKLDITITGRLMVSQGDIISNVTDLLISEYGYNSSWVNRAIRKSDIYALIDNQPLVDYLTINNMSIKPYAFPSNNHLNQLNYSLEVLDLQGVEKYSIAYLSPTSIVLTKNFVNVQTLSLGVWANIGGKFNIRIDSGTYNSGNIWDITLNPKNQDLVLSDKSIPTLNLENLSIQVNETII